MLELHRSTGILRVVFLHWCCSSWIFSVLGAAIAIPVGIRKKSLAPLVFFGSTGAMLDIVQSFADCERERIEKERARELLAGKDPEELADTLHFSEKQWSSVRPSLLVPRTLECPLFWKHESLAHARFLLYLYSRLSTVSCNIPVSKDLFVLVVTLSNTGSLIEMVEIAYIWSTSDDCMSFLVFTQHTFCSFRWCYKHL